MLKISISVLFCLSAIISIPKLSTAGKITITDGLLTLPQGGGIVFPGGSILSDPAGITGPMGPMGPQGLQGSKGDKGDPGVSGNCASVKWLRVGDIGYYSINMPSITDILSNKTVLYDATNGKITGEITTQTVSSSTSTSSNTTLMYCTEYDANNNCLLSSSITNANGIITSIAYTYDSNNIMTSRTKTMSMSGTVVMTYNTNFDALGNYTSETQYNSSGGIMDVATYLNTYDANGLAIKSVVTHTGAGVSNHTIYYQNQKLCL